MATAETVREGGCLCGAIRYRITGEPLTLYCCHCTDCQKQGGSAFAMSMIILRERVELLAGEPRTSTKTFEDDGRQKHARFCGDCGSRLWTELTKTPQIAVVRAGTLDDTRWLNPVGHIWVRSAQPWLVLPEGTLRFEQAPPDTMELIKIYQGRLAQA